MQILTKTGRSLGGVLVRETLARLADGVRGLIRPAERVALAVAGRAVRRVRMVLNDLRRTRARGKRLHVVESLALGSKRQLLLVMCDEQEYLVGAGAESVATIVLRQPGVPVAGGGQTGATPCAAASASSGVSGVAGKMGSTQSPTAPGSGMRQGGETNGPWLVTQDSRGARESRIREADNGKRRGLWR